MKGLGAYERVVGKALEAITRGPWEVLHLHRLAGSLNEDSFSRLGIALGWREAHDWLLSLSEEDRLEFIERLNKNWSQR